MFDLLAICFSVCAVFEWTLSDCLSKIPSELQQALWIVHVNKFWPARRDPTANKLFTQIVRVSEFVGFLVHVNNFVDFCGTTSRLKIIYMNRRGGGVQLRGYKGVDDRNGLFHILSSWLARWEPSWRTTSHSQIKPHIRTRREIIYTKFVYMFFSALS